MRRTALLLLILLASSLRGQDLGKARNSDPNARPAVIEFRDAQAFLLRADEARDMGKNDTAIELYRKAETAYSRLARAYPEWQQGMTQFRISYCANQVRALTARSAAGPTPEPAPASPPVRAAAPVITEATRAQLRGLTRASGKLLAAGDLDEARTLLLQGLDLDPDDPGVRVMVGLLHCQAGQFENAVHVLRALVDERPAAPAARIALGSALFGLGDAAGARAELERALALDMASQEAHYDLARVLLAGDPPDREGARRHYDRSIALGGPADPGLAGQLAGGAPRP